jgi:hypothetical protein
VHELLSGPYGSPLYPYTSSAVAGLVAFSHSSARSPHPCDHFRITSHLFCFYMLYLVVCSRFLCQPRSFPHSTTSCRACSQPSCAFLTNATAIPMLIALTLPAIRANLPPFSRRCFLLSPIAFHHQHFLIPISAAPELILSPQRCPSLQQLCVTSQ